MDRGSIDLKTISYRDVASSSSSAFSFSKPSLYVTIYLLGHGDGNGDGDGTLQRVRRLRHRHKTPLLPHRRDPEWDHPVRIYIDGPDPHLLLLRFELTARVPLLPDRVVGAVSAPVADLYSAGAPLRSASYQVTSPDGKPNGVLSFLYIMNSPSPASLATAKVAAPPPHPPPPPTATAKAKLYPSLLDLIPDLSPALTPAETETPRVCYPAIDPAPPMDYTVVAYPAPAHISGWCYPAAPPPPPPHCGYCGYFAPPGSCRCPARR